VFKFDFILLKFYVNLLSLFCFIYRKQQAYGVNKFILLKYFEAVLRVFPVQTIYAA